MQIASDSPILPAWLVIPAAAATMLLIAGHVLAMHSVRMPPSRRRIRTANSLLMLLIVPLLAYALAIASARDEREFVLVWLTVIGLLWIVVMISAIDVLNTLRMHVAERRALRRRMRETLRRHARGGSGSGASEGALDGRNG